MKKSNRELAQNVALGFCLSEYPDGLSYEEIVRQLDENEVVEDEEGDPLIVVWEPFENLCVVNIMEELARDVERTLNYKDSL